MGIPAGDVLVDALVVPATGDGMEAVHAALERVCAGLCERRPMADAWYDAFVLAVAELAGNIIQYAYPPDAILPQFTLTVLSTPDRLIARLVDRGVPPPELDETAMPPVPASRDLAQISERGRGLAIIRLTTDRFAHLRTDDGENLWLIEKRFSPEAP